MVIILVIVLFLIIFVMIFGLVMYFITRKKEVKVNKVFIYSKKYLEPFKKLNLANICDNWLKSGGYPYGVSAEKYFIITFILIIFSFILISLEGFETGLKFLLAFLAFFNAILYYKITDRNKKMMLELCNIQDIFYFQTKIGTSQDVILAYAIEACGEPLKTPLAKFLDKYKYLHANVGIEQLFEELRSVCSLVEFQAFTFIFEQKEKTGVSLQNHAAQAMMLKRSKRLKRKVTRSLKRVRMLVCSVLLFGCYALFITAPLVKSVLNSLTTLFNN